MIRSNKVFESLEFKYLLYTNFFTVLLVALLEYIEITNGFSWGIFIIVYVLSQYYAIKVFVIEHLSRVTIDD